MKVPRILFSQMREYARAGFRVCSIESRKGSHFKVRFQEIDEPVIITCHLGDSHAMKNNIAALKRKCRHRDQTPIVSA